MHTSQPLVADTLRMPSQPLIFRGLANLRVTDPQKLNKPSTVDVRQPILTKAQSLSWPPDVDANSIRLEDVTLLSKKGSEQSFEVTVFTHDRRQAVTISGVLIDDGNSKRVITQQSFNRVNIVKTLAEEGAAQAKANGQGNLAAFTIDLMTRFLVSWMTRFVARGESVLRPAAEQMQRNAAGLAEVLAKHRTRFAQRNFSAPEQLKAAEWLLRNDSRSTTEWLAEARKEGKNIKDFPPLISYARAVEGAGVGGLIDNAIADLKVLEAQSTEIFADARAVLENGCELFSYLYDMFPDAFEGYKGLLSASRAETEKMNKYAPRVYDYLVKTEPRIIEHAQFFDRMRQ